MKTHLDSRCISYWTWGIFHCYGYDVSLLECVIPRFVSRKTQKNCPKNETEIPCAQALHYQTDGLYFHLLHPTVKLLHQCLGLGKNKYRKGGLLEMRGFFVVVCCLLFCGCLYVCINLYTTCTLYYFFQNEIIASPLLESLWGFRTIKQTPKLN